MVWTVVLGSGVLWKIPWPDKGRWGRGAGQEVAGKIQVDKPGSRQNSGDGYWSVLKSSTGRPLPSSLGKDCHQTGGLDIVSITT